MDFQTIVYFKSKSMKVFLVCFPYAASVWCVVAGRASQDAATTVPPTATATARASRFAAPRRASASSCASNYHKSDNFIGLFVATIKTKQYF